MKKKTKKKTIKLTPWLTVCTDCRIRLVECRETALPHACSLCGSKNFTVSVWK